MGSGGGNRLACKMALAYWPKVFTASDVMPSLVRIISPCSVTRKPWANVRGG